MKTRTIEWWRNLALGDPDLWEREILGIMEILRSEEDQRTAISVLGEDALHERAAELRRRFPQEGPGGASDAPGPSSVFPWR